MHKEKNQNKWHVWNLEKIESTIQQFVQDQGRLPVAREMNKRNKLPSRISFEKVTGMTLGEYGKLHYPELVELREIRHRQHVLDTRKEISEWTEGKLLAAVTGFFERHNRVPQVNEYNAENGLPNYTVFCKIAEKFLTNHLTDYFQEDINILSEKENSEGVGYTRYTTHLPGDAALLAQEKQAYGYDTLKQFCAHLADAVAVVVRKGLSENENSSWYIESNTLQELTGIDIYIERDRELFFSMLDERQEVVNWFCNEDLSGIGLDFDPKLCLEQDAEQTSNMGMRL